MGPKGLVTYTVLFLSWSASRSSQGGGYICQVPEQTDDGLVEATGEATFSSFPANARLNDEVMSQVTLEHMLAMSSGLPWSEGHPWADPRNDLE